MSALLLKYAVSHPNAAIGIVGPSWRQSKRIIARIAAFAHKLPAGIAYKPQKTKQFNVTDLTLSQKRRPFVCCFAEGGFVGFDKRRVGDQTYYVFIYKN